MSPEGMFGFHRRFFIWLIVDGAALYKKDIKAQRVTLDAVKDHLIPHVAENTSTK